MKNMRTLLKLLGAVTLTGLPATTVIACGSDTNETKVLADKVSENLNLTDTSGKGLKVVNLDWNNYEPYFSIDDSDIVVTNLLVGDVTTGEAKAKDQASFDFLRAVLLLQLKSGTTFADGIFDATDVAKIKHKVSDISISTAKFVEPNDEQKIIVSSGTYSLQFFKEDGTTNLGDKYQVKVATNTNALFNIFGTDDPIKLTDKEFIYTGSPIELFAANLNIELYIDKWVNNKIEVPLISSKRTDPAIKFNYFEELIGWKAKFNVKTFTKFATNVDDKRVETGDKLILAITWSRDNETVSLKANMTLIAK